MVGALVMVVSACICARAEHTPYMAGVDAICVLWTGEGAM